MLLATALASAAVALWSGARKGALVVVFVGSFAATFVLGLVQLSHIR